MQENAMILSEGEAINSLLYKPIVATQRIKYTCLNVSLNYIVLGSTSGSLYLFTREPCTFQQLIPLSEGPVCCVVMSPDEKTIALATKRGSVCSVGIKPTIKLLAISREHVGEMVTCLCWNDNSSEIYIGDGIGKISTMVLSKFSVNGMFQAPSCALMHLDSTIVQMEFSGHLLLVSTMTRCYICDTAQEQFKQIGNKARDGEFGACFLTSKHVDDETYIKKMRQDEREKDVERTVNVVTETNGDTKDDRETKIYCARPGFRLWEVTTNGTVVKTHQFKDALAIPSTLVYRTSIDKTSRARIEQNRSTQQIGTNFSHLFALCGKYLFSYTRSSIFVIDPTNATVISWNSEYTNITMARTIDDKIYLMRENGIFHNLRLTAADTLILEFYEKKIYHECLRACKVLKPELLKSMIVEKQLELKVEDNTNNSSKDNNEISAILVSIISLIKSNLNSQPIKLNSGIVLVNSGIGKHRNDEKRNIGNALENLDKNVRNNDVYGNNENLHDTNLESSGDETSVICENLMKKRASTNDECEIANDTRTCIDLISTLNINDKSVLPKENERLSMKIDTTNDETCSLEIDEATSNIQIELNSIYVLINNIKPSMRSTEMEDVIIEVRKRMNEINENYRNIHKLKDFLYEMLRSTERHYYNVLLENITKESLISMRNENVVNEILKSFMDINISCIDECTCGYIYPNEKPREPTFLEIGKILLEKFFNEGKRERCIKLCNSVTFMWRHYLPMSIVDYTIIDDILCMCLRTRDNIVLSTILPMLDVRQWEIAVKCIKDMEMGICPCCDRRNDNFNSNKIVINWSEVARELMKREGTSSALTFLVLIETVLPNVKLNKSIFQSLIFTKILDHYGLEKSVDFDKNEQDEYGAMCSPKVGEQLLDSMEKDLERPMKRNMFGTGPYHWGLRFQAKSSICPCCTLSLNTPVLLGEHGISLFPCGHVYHVSCLLQKKLSRCNLH